MSEHRPDGPVAVAAGPRAARRGGRRHGPDRRRRAGRGRHRAPAPSRRHGRGDDALRAAEDLRLDHDRAWSCAAFGFDADTFAPTYRLLYGTPGRSLALEVAGRLGLNPSILDEARRNISEREAQLAEHLAKVDSDLRDARARAAPGGPRTRVGGRDRSAAARRARQSLKDKEERLRQQARRRDRDAAAGRAPGHRQGGRRLAQAGREAVGRGRRGARCTASRCRRAMPGWCGRTPGPPSTRWRTARQGEAATPGCADTEDAGRAAARGRPRAAAAAWASTALVTAVQDGEAEVDVRGKRLRVAIRGPARDHGGRRPGGTGRPATRQCDRARPVAGRTGDRPERDRLHGRRGAGTRRTVPGRSAAGGQPARSG